MAKIICIVPKYITINQQIKVIQKFTKLGFLNIAFVQTFDNVNIRYMVYNSVKKSGLLIINPNSIDSVFTDKLKDMRGYAYKIPIYHQPPAVHIFKEKYNSYMIYFADLLRKIQGANLHTISLTHYSQI